MSEMSRFLDLLTKLRAGDEQAAADLCAEYGPAIRRTVRFRLRNLPLQRIVGEEDVCQSVLKSFCLRCRLGQFDVENAQQLLGLLHRMARHKLINHIRNLGAVKRGNGRAAEVLNEQCVAARGDAPSTRLSDQELFNEALEQMTAEEREIRRLRLDVGLCWADVARRLDGTAETAASRRKQWERTRDRIIAALDLRA